MVFYLDVGAKPLVAECGAKLFRQVFSRGSYLLVFMGSVAQTAQSRTLVLIRLAPPFFF